MTETQRVDLEFPGILGFGRDGHGSAEPPPCFRDLNLDQVVDAIVSGREEYDLRPFFHAPLRDAAAVAYRHEVFRELESREVRAAVSGFGAEMRRVRRHLLLARDQRHRREQQRWLLDAAAGYCDAVSALLAALVPLELDSEGFRELREHLARYAASDRFASLAADARAVLDGLARVRYTLRIRGPRVTVSTYEDEPDYGAEVERVFARFRQGDVEDHLFATPDSGSMDHVEARIAELVARLHPDEFRAVDEFCERHRGFVEPSLARFDREIQFYLAYLEHVERLGGLPFSYPEVSTGSKDEAVEDAFDVALATKLAAGGGRVVRNGFSLSGRERILVVTGPNQGGKTTFARMVGQLHHLAALGVPVPGRSARLFLADRILTHFGREEDIATLRGRLDDELVRMRDILEQATGDSLLVVNEVLSSTTLVDAVRLGTRLLERVAAVGCLAVCVTFVDELASLGETTVSMVAGVDPADPSRRTFELVRRPADGRAYAWALAEKYRLSYERLRSRIGS